MKVVDLRSIKQPVLRHWNIIGWGPLPMGNASFSAVQSTSQLLPATPCSCSPMKSDWMSTPLLACRAAEGWGDVATHQDILSKKVDASKMKKALIEVVCQHFCWTDDPNKLSRNPHKFLAKSHASLGAGCILIPKVSAIKASTKIWNPQSGPV